MTNKDLSKPAKITATKTLTELGYSIRKIAEIMNIDPKTVLRYQDKEIEPEWVQFSTTIKKLYMEQDFEVSSLAYKRIKETLPKAELRDAIGAYKVSRELQEPKGIGVATQVNVFNKVLEEERKEFNL